MKFFLICPDDDVSFIYLDINFNGSRFRLSTGISIPVKYWNYKLQKADKSAIDSKEINNKLKNAKQQIDSFLIDIKIKSIVLNKSEFQSAIKNILNPKQIDMTIKPVLDYFEDYLNNLKQVQVIRQSSIDSYESVYKSFKTYEKYSGKVIHFEDINLSLYDDIISFLVSKNNSNSHIKYKIKVFKIFLRYCIKEEIYTNKDILKSPIIKSQVNNALVVLSEDEIKKIKELSLDDDFAKVRDLFLVQIQTMLRFSDLKNLKPANIDFENKIISIHQHKTNDFLRIPLTDNSIDILRKYIDEPFYTMEKYNDILNNICKLAGINEPIEIVKISGNKRISKVLPKYMLITSHCARRTGITYLLIKGVPAEVIRKISGHRNIDAFQKYIKITENYAVERVKNVWNSTNSNNH